MLILSGDRVRRCRIENPEPGTHGTLDAIAYRDALYRFVGRYSPDERQAALLAVRELLDADRFCLLLQEPEGFSLWEQAPGIQGCIIADRPTEEPVVPETPPPATPTTPKPIPQTIDNPVDATALDLVDVIEAMYRAEPPLIRDRRYHLRVFPQVFVGQEAVQWFLQQFGLTSRVAAVRLGQRLLDENLACHVTSDHQFEDRFLFYRFLADEADLASLKEVLSGTETIEPDEPFEPTARELETLVGGSDLAQLVAKMRAAENLVGNRRYMLKVYPKSFVGYEAVDWLVGYLGISRSQAIELGRRLLAEGWICHVTNEHHFEDRYLFYKFLDRDPILR